MVGFSKKRPEKSSLVDIDKQKQQALDMNTELSWCLYLEKFFLKWQIKTVDKMKTHISLSLSLSCHRKSWRLRDSKRKWDTATGAKQRREGRDLDAGVVTLGTCLFMLCYN